MSTGTKSAPNSAFARARTPRRDNAAKSSHVYGWWGQWPVNGHGVMARRHRSFTIGGVMAHISARLRLVGQWRPNHRTFTIGGVNGQGPLAKHHPESAGNGETRRPSPFQVSGGTRPAGRRDPPVLAGRFPCLADRWGGLLQVDQVAGTGPGGEKSFAQRMLEVFLWCAPAGRFPCLADRRGGWLARLQKRCVLFGLRRWGLCAQGHPGCRRSRRVDGPGWKVVG